jgi:hypothetical protein
VQRVTVAPRIGPKTHAILISLAAMLACLTIGVLAAADPRRFGELMILLPPAVALGIASRAPWAFCVGSLLLVSGYICFNRGFAGFHLPWRGTPFYVGELALLLLLFPALKRLRGRSLGAPIYVLAGWMTFNAFLTVPNIAAYGLNAIRDAAMWYYGLYALVGAAVWYATDRRIILRWFNWIFLGALLAASVGLITSERLWLPFSDHPLPGDRADAPAMHLLGGAVFFLTVAPNEGPRWPRWVTILIIGLSLGLVVTMQVRAAYIALFGVLLLLVLYRRWRPVTLILSVTAGLVGLIWILNLEVERDNQVWSARTIIERQLSTLVFLSGEEDESQARHSGTIRWRLIWWEALVEEAIDEPVTLLVGRGYGPDLTDAVAGSRALGFFYDQGKELGLPVRSPHNIIVTFFARSGAIGLAAWLLLLYLSLERTLKGTFACRSLGDRQNQLFGVWLSAYLVAILLVSSFGVVLESPFGAIPFFWLMGLGIAWGTEQLARVREPVPIQASKPRKLVPARMSTFAARTSHGR